MELILPSHLSLTSETDFCVLSFGLYYEPLWPIVLSFDNLLLMSTNHYKSIMSLSRLIIGILSDL